jgi:RimJ/RimL family protein N-acetyltransferase
MTKKVCSRKEKSTMLLQTARIFLREFTYDDFDSLFEILSDAEVMKYYPKPFDAERVKGWIKWNLQNYKQYGFGLWAVCLKDSGKMIGDCGITIQNIDGELLPEIGYHIHKDFWRQGFATEAAAAVRDWAFENTKYDCLYSYMKYSNVPSYKTAQKIGTYFYNVTKSW